MAEKILITGISDILKKVYYIAEEEIGAAWGVKGEFEKLKHSLLMIQAVLVDAERRQVEEERVKLWLKRLEQVYYDADDVLDEFEYELLRHQMEIKNRFKAKVRNFFQPTNPIVFRFKMAHKIKDINQTLADLKKSMDMFKFNGTTVVLDHQLYMSDRRTSSQDIKESQIVGRETDKTAIMNRLINNSQDQEADFSVISIVGIGGLGKTTVAQFVYNDELVEKCFDVKIWVCVSKEFDVEKILRDIIESITQTKCGLSSMDVIVSTLHKNINGKKFLLVLDDVWNEDPARWERLKTLLGCDAPRGSKIVVTTRSLQVALIVGPPATHYNLQKLQEKDCWFLFKTWAFREGGVEESSRLTEIGKDIVKKCGGVPLALMHLGRLMHLKKHEHEWLRIKDSEVWNLTETKRIIAVLKLSYDNLTPPLKQCFSYCAMFGKDELIDKTMLIQIWMAEGFLGPPQGSHMVMEEVGEEYFNILMLNSFFQYIERDEFDRILDFNMHDLVHDLACSVMGPDSSFDKVEDGHQIRRLSSALELIQELPSANKLRTCMLLVERSPDPDPDPVKLEFNSDFLKLKYVRVLDLSFANTTELPSSVCKLRHLRFLDLSHTNIATLPNSICSLYHLQTLRLLFCKKLGNLPKDMKKLIGLRHLEIMGCKELSQMPSDIGHLSSLQTLSKFMVGKEGSGCTITELQHLNLGGELEIQKLELVTNATAAKVANLDKKSNIHSLKFYWSESSIDELTTQGNPTDVIEALQPHSNLKRLEVHCFVGMRYPTWMNVDFLPSLVKMCLSDCKLCECLPPLGQLRYLKFLKISDMPILKCIGDEFYGYGIQEAGDVVFPSLRTLILHNLPSLEKWMEPVSCSRSFAMLEKLKVQTCSMLTETPSQFPSLKELAINKGGDSLLISLSCKVSSLTSLRIENIVNTTSLPQGLLQKNNLLRQLTIWECTEIGSLPESLRDLKSLESLQFFNCTSLTSVPDLSCLASLRQLLIVGLKEIKACLPEWVCYLPLLDTLEIGGFADEFDFFPIEGIQQIVSLRTLALHGWPNIKTLPEQLQHLNKLRQLSIINFKDLVSLPDWLSNLSSLKALKIRKCENLKSLPGGLASLSYLNIVDCPVLKGRCTRETGEEWHKIVHIPSIQF